MKFIKIFLFSFLLLVILLPEVNAQEMAYTEGSVWDISYIKTKAPYFEDYMNNLNSGWRAVMDEAKKEGLILGYKVLSSSPQDQQDWDLMLMIEYKNMAALDNLQPRMLKIQEKLFGAPDSRKASALSRNEIRELMGGKLARELHFK
jgi:hypothetical protein